MKWMAAGEIGSFILGLTSAIASWMFFGNLATVAKIAVFLVVLYIATKWSLRLVHLGYDRKANERT